MATISVFAAVMEALKSRMDDVDNSVLIKGLGKKQSEAATMILADAYMTTKWAKDIEKPSLVFHKEARVDARELHDHLSYDKASGALKLTFPVEKGALDPHLLQAAVGGLYREVFNNPLTRQLTISIPDEKETRRSGSPKFKAVDAVVIAHPVMRGEGVDAVLSRGSSQMFATLQYERVDLLLEGHGQSKQCWRALDGIDGIDRNGRMLFIEHPSVLIGRAAFEKLQKVEKLPDLPPLG